MGQGEMMSYINRQHFLLSIYLKDKILLSLQSGSILLESESIKKKVSRWSLK